MPGEFKISINGDPEKEGGFDKLMNLLEPRFEVFAPGYKSSVYSFARVYYRYEVTGVPKRFEVLDNLVKSMKIGIEKYLKNWAYEIEVKFIEGG